MALQNIFSFNEQLKNQTYRILHQKEAGLETSSSHAFPRHCTRGQVVGQEEHHHPPDRLVQSSPSNVCNHGNLSMRNITGGTFSN